jgi:ABC-type sugar transport system substrate-binding protein
MKRTGRLAVMLASGVAAALAMTACASSPTGSGGSGEGVKVGMVGLYNLPYITATAAGSQAAADKVGATFTQYGPQGLDPNKAIADFQNAVAAGNKGMLVFPYPGELWASPLNRAIDQGITVASTDVYSDTSKVMTHVGTAKVAMGAALADEYLKQIPNDAQGEIVPGICVAGLEVLMAPLGGFTTRIEEERPGVKVIEPEVTSGDPGANFAAWQRIVAKYPDAVGFVGLCDVDVPNLVKVKQADPNATFLTGVTAGGDDPTAIQALGTGLMVGAISQRPWVEGYVGMSFVLNNLTKGAPMPDGWVNTGYEIVTKDNLATLTPALTDPAAAAEYYGALADKLVQNPNPHKPYAYVYDPASINEPNPTV